MPITPALTNAFLLRLATDFFAAYSFKLALIKPSMVGTYSAATTNYSQLTANGDEVTGTGYTAGGVVLSEITPIISGGMVILDYGDASWPSALTIQVRGAMLYIVSSGEAVLVDDFGQTLVADPVAGFTVQFPAAVAASAIIRWAAAA